MDNPEDQIQYVIQSLTLHAYRDQKRTLEDYFLPNAYFVHPFCRVPSFNDYKIPYTNWTINSRMFVFYIYQWYRILSPEIKLEVNSTSFDQKNNLLYVTLHQAFTLWFIPFSLWQANVKLVTVLELEHLPIDERNKPLLGNRDAQGSVNGDSAINDEPWKLYFIKGQQDHYHVEDFLKFIAPWGASLLWNFWQLWATLVCALGVIFLRTPIAFLRGRVLGLDSSAIKKKQYPKTLRHICPQIAKKCGLKVGDLLLGLMLLALQQQNDHIDDDEEEDDDVSALLNRSNWAPPENSPKLKPMGSGHIFLNGNGLAKPTFGVGPVDRFSLSVGPSQVQVNGSPNYPSPSSSSATTSSGSSPGSPSRGRRPSMRMVPRTVRFLDTVMEKSSQDPSPPGSVHHIEDLPEEASPRNDELDWEKPEKLDTPNQPEYDGDNEGDEVMQAAIQDAIQEVEEATVLETIQELTQETPNGTAQETTIEVIEETTEELWSDEVQKAAEETPVSVTKNKGKGKAYNKPLENVNSGKLPNAKK
ncbi:uncharacterized protein F4822DRAFT_444756 [Hypoxylon trugodes]|uniref:uncharacterized protein n=1 Tax=Hypoxylon trugodes TaxID=326681 RepID=UPI00219DD249|nr:uncharacterized protein F4822DRAFT_444756 [Hypoxylon trugodes]KAI1386360.1 hypothetical protein F4822DRAFT_444756 [Hypoxylon trugodes]